MPRYDLRCWKKRLTPINLYKSRYYANKTECHNMTSDVERSALSQSIYTSPGTTPIKLNATIWPQMLKVFLNPNQWIQKKHGYSQFPRLIKLNATIWPQMLERALTPNQWIQIQVLQFPPPMKLNATISINEYKKFSGTPVSPSITLYATIWPQVLERALNPYNNTIPGYSRFLCQ